MSPKQKNKLYIRSEKSPPKKKYKYSENKKKSIEACREYLVRFNVDKKWIEMFDSSSKRDDLGDSMLQLLVYAMQKNTELHFKR